MAQGFQDGGLTNWEYFDVGGQSQVPCWGLYESGNMQRGTGNASLDTLNITEPQNKNVVLSELGGGWHYWFTLRLRRLPRPRTRAFRDATARSGLSGSPEVSSGRLATTEPKAAAGVRLRPLFPQGRGEADGPLRKRQVVATGFRQTARTDLPAE